MSGSEAAGATACLLACLPAGARWLRVAQREHYLAGSSSRFAFRWWLRIPANAVLAVAGVAGAGAAFRWPLAALATAAVIAAGPVGLALRGRTSPLAWTRRLRTLAVVWIAVELVVVAVGFVVGGRWTAPIAAVAALAVPLAVDLACAVTAPVERRLSSHFVTDAAARLRRVDPVVVAITGSYGKTSTKNHVLHLVGGSRTVVATPASFNNRAGLARSVNEHLADGTEVFVAEMGTYGPGEIADLCRWCPPTVSVITAIGPVHLERFGSEDRIVAAKSEIIGTARDIVLQVDDLRLAALAGRLTAAGRHVVRCSTSDPAADVCVAVAAADAPPAPGEGALRATVSIGGTVVVDRLVVPTGVQPANLACAIGVARSVGVEVAAIAARLADLPSVAHRLQAMPAPSGATILDDTYNANPAGAEAALAALAALGGSGRRVVVTPGMVELGPRQFEENRRFGAACAATADDLVVVGRTNRRALVAGAAVGSDRPDAPRVVRVAHRERAVGWVRSHLGPGDTVLYENDLPDHYP